MGKHFFYFLFFISSFQLCGQTPVDSLQQLLDATDQDSVRLRLLDEITNLIYQSDYPKTIEYSTEALALAKKLGDAKHEMRAHYFIGVGNLLSSNESIAIDHVKKALDIAENKLSDHDGMMDCHNLLGSIYQELNDIDKSLEHMFEAGRLAQQYDNQDRMATTYSNIGQVYMDNGEYAKARSYYNKALKIFIEREDFFYAAFLYNNLSEVTESSDSSIVLLNKALEIFEKEQYQDGIAHASNNLATEYGNLENYEEALPLLERARHIFESESNHFKPGLVSVYMNLGTVTGELGDMSAAKEWFEKSINLAIEIDHKVYLKDAYEQYSELLENNNNPGDALRYYKLAATVRDSIFNESKAQELAESETKYRTELKEKEITQKELELEIQSRQKNRILLGGIILVLLLTSIFLILRSRQRLKRQKTELNLQLKKAEADKLRALDKVKSNFFTNISHEFRTPLTLILGPLKQMRNGTFKGNISKYQDIMIRNGERLMNLVNQLLDLSKLEDGKMELILEQNNIVETVRAMAYSFESLAERQEINLEVNIPYAGIIGFFDKEKVEKILINLLSNAFKYTPENGTVSLNLDIKKGDKPNEKSEAIVQVRDTGTGIDAEALPHIFERFFQTSNSTDLQAGTGVGLALTKELVELHKGSIAVESELNKGTLVTVVLPIGEIIEGSKKMFIEKSIIVKASEDAMMGLKPNEGTPLKETAPLLLLVEDNDDVRNYVKDQLSDNFRVIEAPDGVEGYDKAIELTPDLIVSDVMMPKRNGIELCEMLKANEKTSHIPVIMLTAKAERADKIEGLQTGADDYLMKPFDAEELKIRIQNLIDQRRRLQKAFGKDFNFNPEAVEVNSVDETFLVKVKTAIEENLEDETFSVVGLGQIVGMSRSQLHRKLKALTNQSPNQIIRGMRLMRAKALLEKNAGNASEVAFMVGFNSLAYFSKCYRDHFGISPSEAQ